MTCLRFINIIWTMAGQRAETEPRCSGLRQGLIISMQVLQKEALRIPVLRMKAPAEVLPVQEMKTREEVLLAAALPVPKMKILAEVLPEAEMKAQETGVLPEVEMKAQEMRILPEAEMKAQEMRIPPEVEMKAMVGKILVLRKSLPYQIRILFAQWAVWWIPKQARLLRMQL